VRASIKQVWEKIKGFVHEMKEELLVCFIIILVGISAFGLGKLSVYSSQDDEVRILSQYTNTAAAVESTGLDQIQKSVNGEVVASKSGKKYHYPWCAGAKQISEKNKITFNTIEGARAAGYTPAANCKGLK
jgi:hypothetical protein